MSFLFWACSAFKVRKEFYVTNEVATYNDYQCQRLLVKPGMTRYWQTRRNRDSITFDEWVGLDLWWAYAFSPSC